MTYTEPRPARQIPTRQQLEVAARRQAPLEEAEQEFDIEGIEEVYEDVWPPRMPTSTRRYQSIPDERTSSADRKSQNSLVGRTRERQTVIPPRRSAKQLQVGDVYRVGDMVFRYQGEMSPQQEQRVFNGRRERQVYTGEIETPAPKRPRQKRSLHPLLYLGVGMVAMAALFLLLSSASTWLHQKSDDLTYGNPRTFNIDAYVGHNDSQSNPSHFIAINLHRHVEVIEIPGQDSTKERTFPITTLFGDGQDLTPVTLSFRDVNGDGKPDMLIHIELQTLVLINDNGTFRPAKAGEVKGIV